MARSYKWFLLVLLSLAYFFNQADRVLFGLRDRRVRDDGCVFTFRKDRTVE